MTTETTTKPKAKKAVKSKAVKTRIRKPKVDKVSTSITTPKSDTSVILDKPSITTPVESAPLGEPPPFIPADEAVNTPNESINTTDNTTFDSEEDIFDWSEALGVTFQLTFKLVGRQTKQPDIWLLDDEDAQKLGKVWGGILNSAIGNTPPIVKAAAATAAAVLPRVVMTMQDRKKTVNIPPVVMPVATEAG
jgi:hypothetical protein